MMEMMQAMKEMPKMAESFGQYLSQLVSLLKSIDEKQDRIIELLEKKGEAWWQ